MRHLGSLALSAIGGPMLYVWLGLGTVRLDRAAERLAGGSDGGSLDLVIGIGLVLFAASWLWVFLGVRLSPVGPALVGAGLGALGVLAVSAPDRLADLIPNDVFGVDGARAAPAPALLLIALPLVGTLLSRRRWQGPGAGERLSDHPIDAPL